MTGAPRHALRRENWPTDAIDALQRLEAENAKLRNALSAAIEWLETDLVTDPKPITEAADRELIAEWRATLDV